MQNQGFKQGLEVLEWEKRLKIGSEEEKEEGEEKMKKLWGDREEGRRNEMKIKNKK